MQLPAQLLPHYAHLHGFANFFWTYVTTSFDNVAHPQTLLIPECGCLCPLCARFKQAPHLQPKRLTKADKRRAFELMVDRVLALANEAEIDVSAKRCRQIALEPRTRRSAAFSTYGYWLIDRLSGVSDGPAILALWRETAWNKQGSPTHRGAARF